MATLSDNKKDYPNIWEDADEKFSNIRCAGECQLPLYPHCLELGDLMDSTVTCVKCKRLVCNACRWYFNYKYTCYGCRVLGARKDYFENYPERCGHSFLARFLRSLRRKQIEYSGVHSSVFFSKLPEDVALKVFEFA